MNGKNLFFKSVSFFLLFAVLLSTTAIYVGAEDDIPDTSFAENICLYNVNTEKIIYSKNTDKRIFPGSSVKMMSGLIACEMLADRLDETVMITEEMLADNEGANVRLKAGMRVTVENLLYGVLCGGGNDASLVLATLCSGSITAFVEQMNATAEAWGLKNTYFTNPTGLDDKNMYSTLGDIMTIAKRAYQNEKYIEFSSATSYIYTPIDSEEQIKIFNRNCLISTYYSYGYKNPNAVGLIAGNTDLSGYSAITYAERGSSGYICAVMNAVEEDGVIYSFELVNKLLSYAFGSFSYIKIAEKGQYVCDTEVLFTMPRSENQDVTLNCVIKDDVYALTAADIDPKYDLKYRYYFHYDDLRAPITEGMIIGGVDIIYNGEIIGNAPIVAQSDVEASKLLISLHDLRSFFSSTFFLFSLLYLIIGLVGYYYFSVLRFRKRNSKRINYKNFY